MSNDNCMLNKTAESLNQCIRTVEELTSQLKESNDKIEAILNLIDARIKENKELAIIHYPQPGDEYINEYESRAYELEQLKKLIIGELDDD